MVDGIGRQVVSTVGSTWPCSAGAAHAFSRERPIRLGIGGKWSREGLATFSTPPSWCADRDMGSRGLLRHRRDRGGHGIGQAESSPDLSVEADAASYLLYHRTEPNNDCQEGASDHECAHHEAHTAANDYACDDGGVTDDAVAGTCRHRLPSDRDSCDGRAVGPCDQLSSCHQRRQLLRAWRVLPDL